MRLLFSLLMLPCMAFAQVATLQIQIVEGEGAVHAPGSRSLRPLTVEVTDETGRPVPQAAVSFHLPDDGPGGAFLSGLRTEIAMTDAAGRASIRSLQWNHTPGRFQIRIVASREQARAGTVSFQYIGEPGGRLRAVPAAPSPTASSAPAVTATPGASRGRTRWVVLAALLAAGVTAGAVNGARSKTGSPSAGATAAPAVTLTIGNPTITVGKP